MPKFLEELHRRSLFRVAAGYLVVAWVLIQVAATILPAFTAPGWVLQVVVLFVGLGFPIALVLAWAYGDSAAEAEAADGPALTRRSMVTDGVLVAAMVLLIGITAFSLRGGGDEQVAVEAIEEVSIAVLAFRDLSPAADQVHFAEGISEEILNKLAQVPELRVAARTSSFAMSGDEFTARQISNELNVRYVLEGSVRIDGNNMRITAQLNDGTTGYHMWSENFDRQREEIFAVQDDVANLILAALNDRIGTSFAEVEAEQGTDSVEAYSAYLLGRHHMQQRDAEPMRRAVEAFQQAIELDPEYADAYAAMGRAYYLNYGAFESDEAVAEPMRDALYQAINLDPDNAVAIATLGLILNLREWRFVEAGILARRAYELAPDDIEIKMSYVNFLVMTGRHRDAYFLIQDILEADADFTPAVNNLQGVLIALGEYGIVMRQVLQAREGIEDELQWVGMTMYAALLAWRDGQEDVFSRMDAELGAAAAGDPLFSNGIEIWRATLRASRGDPDDLLTMIDDGRVEQFYNDFEEYEDVDIALTLAGVGRFELALPYFQRALDRKDGDILEMEDGVFIYPEGMFDRPELAPIMNTPEIRTLRQMRRLAREQGQADPLSPEELNLLTN